ncbi:MAG: hypothetical protein HY423_13105 [Candidatus Lambdaproteobacteria bacterium]|nr:hypothetical protein [Candidatus Lambdaproteobacteria bacterium]
MMQFERAINDATTLFLFDRRSQQQLQEMAEGAMPGSRDRYLIRLTQAAFHYYNAVDAQAFDMRGAIRQAQLILREVKRFREDRAFYTMALRLEVDLLMHLSRLTYEEAAPQEKLTRLFNEEDQQALLICETLLKNLPPTLDTLPNTWYTALIPLFPPYREQVIQFYSTRAKDDRIEVLAGIMRQIKAELITLAGIVMAKRFIAERSPRLQTLDRVRSLLTANIKDLTTRIKERVPPLMQVTVDVSLPKGISRSQIEFAIRTIQERIDQSRAEKDMRKLASVLLHQGILYFLNDEAGEAVKAMVNTLRASAQIPADDKKQRQYRHEQFPDIPFIVGTSYLKTALAGERGLQEEEKRFLEQARTALIRAVQLQPHYHQAYVNLLLVLALLADPGEDDIISLYLQSFEGSLANLSGLGFRNKALRETQSNANALTPDAVKWLVLSLFCAGGELTKAKRLLQELKTLYLLNAHDYVVPYLEEYRTLFRIKDPEFVADLEDASLHGAMLFYIAHAFTSLALVQGRKDTELAVDHANLDQAIELNGEALFFNRNNSSAVRLVETQAQIIEFAFQRTDKRWENIQAMIGQRFQLYEEYLRQQKSYTLLREKLATLHMEAAVPEIKLAPATVQKMESTITSEQRERLSHRVGLA